MNQENIERGWALALLVFSFIATAIASLSGLNYAWGGCSGNLRLECSAVTSIVGIFLLISRLVILFSIFLIVKPICSKKIFKIFFFMYLVAIVVTIGLTLSLHRGGFLYSKIKGTEIECKYFHGYGGSNSCYTELAISTSNIDYCKKEGVGTDCYTFFAKKNGDISLCQLGNNACIMDVAREIKDATLCERIDNDYDKSQCYAVMAGVTGDLTLCRKSDDSFPLCKDAKKTLYTATSLSFQFLPPIKNEVRRGEKNVELAKIKINAIGGDAAIVGLPFYEIEKNINMMPKISNIGIYNGSELIPAQVTTSFLDNEYHKDTMYYNFYFKSGDFVVSRNKPFIVTIKGDVWSNAGKIRFEQIGFSGYPELIQSSINAMGGRSEQVSIQ